MFSAVSRKIGLACLLPVFLLPVIALFMHSAGVHAQESKPISRTAEANLKKIRSILALPDDQIDLGNVKLSVDRMIDPSIDMAGNLKRIDSMVKEVETWIPSNASSRDRLDALRSYLYKAGPWNGYKPFQYDSDDPLGRNIMNKLLPTYLATRKGNCVSMPILFVILGRRIGLDVTLSTAPEHLFVKYREDAEHLYNLETTSGAGFTRDVWMRQQSPMTDQALASGIYMKPLSKKEEVAVIAEVLMEYYSQLNMEEERISLAKVTLKYYKKHVMAMLHICSASYRLRENLFMKKYKTPDDIPPLEKPYFKELDGNLRYWREKADALGWKEFDQSINKSNKKNAFLTRSSG